MTKYIDKNELKEAFKRHIMKYDRFDEEQAEHATGDLENFYTCPYIQQEYIEDLQINDKNYQKQICRCCFSIVDSNIPIFSFYVYYNTDEMKDKTVGSYLSTEQFYELTGKIEHEDLIEVEGDYEHFALANALFNNKNDYGGIAILGFEWGPEKELDPNATEKTFFEKAKSPEDQEIIQWFEVLDQPLDKKLDFDKCIVQVNRLTAESVDPQNTDSEIEGFNQLTFALATFVPKLAFIIGNNVSKQWPEIIAKAKESEALEYLQDVFDESIATEMPKAIGNKCSILKLEESIFIFIDQFGPHVKTCLENELYDELNEFIDNIKSSKGISWFYD